MAQAQLEHTRQISMEDLKELSKSAGPCVTICLPLHHEDTRQLRPTAKAALRDVEQRLERELKDRNVLKAFMEPLRDLPESEFESALQSVILLRSNDVFQRLFVPQHCEESITVADHFNLLPLIPMLRESRPFYILALSQKHIRLLRCTNTTSQEIALPPSVPTNLDDFLQNDQPDHVLDNSSSGGPGTGSMGRVMFGTGSDIKERKDEYLRHFYKNVDAGVAGLLRGEMGPLVVAGVEYEIAEYRRQSMYPQLVDEAVRGAPDGLKGGELHKRAFEVVQGHWQKEVDDALAMYEQLGGSNRTSVSVKEIVKAAYDGRILHLLVAPGPHQMGNFDEMTHRVRAHRQEEPGDEDLVNAAAVETLRHAGNVFVVPASKIPHGSQMAAVMRY